MRHTLLLLLLLGLPATSRAATLSVGAGQPFATITDALAAAAVGDVIEIDAGTYDESLTIAIDVSLVGLGGSAATTLRGPSPLGISNAIVTIEGLTVEATSGRAIDAGTATLTLVDLVVSDAVTTGPGAGLRAIGSTVVVTDSTFDGNLTTSSGGHAWLDASTATFERCAFLSGDAFDGGAIYAEDSTLTVIDATFTANDADELGGAINLLRSGYEIVGSTFLGNTADSTGGAIRADEGGDGLIDGCTFEGNSGSYGGAVYQREDGNLDVVGSTFVGNIAFDGGGSGGAIRWFATDQTTPVLTVSGSTFVDNEADDKGGAIGADSLNGTLRGTLHIEDSSFTANEATRGGAVSAEAINAAIGTGNTFCANVGFTSGGGVRVFGAAFVENTWTHNLFVENTSGVIGGGMFVQDAGAAVVRNNTFAGNGSAAGGGLDAENTVVQLVGNAVTFSTGGSGYVANPVLGSRDYNLWFGNAPGNVGGALGPANLGANAVFADPMFVAWSADGDCSNDDFSPAVGSPMIDAGDPASIDADCTISDIGATGATGAAGVSDCDGDGHLAGADCNDTDPAINPDALEICDGVDNDCDGLTDDATAPGAVDWYGDADADGWGDEAKLVTACDAPPAHVSQSGDCDDTKAAANPAAAEVCDGIDNNCDDAIDEGLTTAYWPDADGDGYGTGDVAVDACEPPVGHAPEGGDCDDTTAAVSPAAVEVCNAIDDNCDSEVDEGLLSTWYADADADGWGNPELSEETCTPGAGWVSQGEDCDDTDDDVNPAADDAWADGIDDDCDGFDGRPGSDEGLLVGNGCSCDSGSGAPVGLLGGLWLVPLLLRRRRAR